MIQSKFRNKIQVWRCIPVTKDVRVDTGVLQVCDSEVSLGNIVRISLKARVWGKIAHVRAMWYLVEGRKGKNLISIIQCWILNLLDYFSLRWYQQNWQRAENHFQPKDPFDGQQDSG